MLRKHGVRFGAYHVYMPLLLKPAPRGLAAQLWVLKHGGEAETHGFDELQRLAASGRTSFAADKDTPRPLYRTIGYRVCGERAVRVDILERLADSFRPALAWRPGSLAPKPSGGVRGHRLYHHPGHDSLTGCSGEDFAGFCAGSAIAWSGVPSLSSPPQTAAPAPAAATEPEGQEAGVVAESAVPGTEYETTESRHRRRNRGSAIFNCRQRGCRRSRRFHHGDRCYSRGDAIRIG